MRLGSGKSDALRERLAGLLTSRIYRARVIGDRPRSRVYYAVRYGSWKKLRNYLRIKHEYRTFRTTLRGYPYAVRVEPMSACNLHCPLCPTGAGEIDRKPASMSAETLDAILDRCGEYALYAHLWIWGEPLLNKQLAELAAVCRRHGVGSEVSSHLSIRLSTEQIDALIQSGLDWLIVSLDAASRESYDRYRIGGSFDQVVRNLRNIVERKCVLGAATPFVEWQFVPFRHNEHEVEDVFRLAREIGVDGVRLKPARLDKLRNHTFEGSLESEWIQQWAPKDPALFHAPAQGRPSYLDYHCAFLWGTVSIYADGAMAPCCETSLVRDDLGNLFDRDFRAIWNGPSYVRARRVALGLGDGAEDASVACQGCKVFGKPLAPATPLARRDHRA